MPRVAAHDAIAHEQKRGTGGVEEEIGGERRDAADGRSGQVGGMDEDDYAGLVRAPPQFVLAIATEAAFPRPPVPAGTGSRVCRSRRAVAVALPRHAVNARRPPSLHRGCR
jgi:hypothetical protein